MKSEILTSTTDFSNKPSYLFCVACTFGQERENKYAAKLSKEQGVADQEATWPDVHQADHPELKVKAAQKKRVRRPLPTAWERPSWTLTGRTSSFLALISLLMSVFL